MALPPPGPGALLLLLPPGPGPGLLNRLYEYMDAKETKKEQEEDDIYWITRFNIPNNTHNDYTPNPTRNKAKIEDNYSKLNTNINQIEDALLSQGIRITKINQPGGQGDPNLYQSLYQSQGATSPLLG